MNIRNFDENGKIHGLQIDYYPNGNILAITNYHHGKPNGYQGWFKSDKSISYKEYYDMDKLIYVEGHRWSEQIEITI